MDLSALTVEDTSAPVSEAKEESPVCQWLRDSFERKTWKRIPVPAFDPKGEIDAKRMHALLLQASRVTGLGVKIRLVHGKTEVAPSKDVWAEVEKLGKRQVYVKFLGKVKTDRPRKVSATAATNGS